jgi:MYXO-CTERM domain-containing protein
VTIDKTTSGSEFGGGSPKLAILVKPGEPIRWNPDSLTHDAPLVAPIVVEAEAGHAGRGVVTGKLDPGVYYVQISNGGDSWWLARTRVTTDVEPVAPDDGGCAVGGAGGGGSAGWLGAAAGLLLLVRRRRTLVVQGHVHGAGRRVEQL